MASEGAGPGRISVVMATHGRRDLLPIVLPPLLEDPAAAEVVVASDGNEDGTEQLLADWAAREPKLRPVTLAPTGRQGARRAALAASREAIVLLLDDDVRALPGLVGGHAAAHPGSGVRVVMGYMPVRPVPGATGRSVPTELYAAEYEQHCAALDAEPGEVLRRLWGGNVSLPRDLALAVTEEEFPASFGEDTHLGLLCLRLGATGVFDRRLAAEHLHRRTLGQFVANSFEQGRGLAWLHELHGDLLGPLDEETAVLGGLPRVVRRAILRAGDGPLELAVAGACAVSGAAHRLHGRGAERLATRLARKLAGHRGVRQAQREVAAARAGRGHADRGR